MHRLSFTSEKVWDCYIFSLAKTGKSASLIMIYYDIYHDDLFSEISLNPNLGVCGGGGNFTPLPSWFSLNNSKKVKAVTLEFCSIQ